MHRAVTEPCEVHQAARSRLSVALVNDLLAADAGRPTHWRDFCAFVEAWSSCKTQNLARVANAWLRRAIWEDAGPGSAEKCVMIV